MTYTEEYSQKAIEQAKALLRGEYIAPEDAASDLQALLEQSLTELAHDLLQEGETVYATISFNGQNYRLYQQTLVDLSNGTLISAHNDDGSITYMDGSNNYNPGNNQPTNPALAEDREELEQTREELANRLDEIDSEISNIEYRLDNFDAPLDIDKLDLLMDDEDASAILAKIKEEFGGTNFIQPNDLYAALNRIVNAGTDERFDAESIIDTLDKLTIVNHELFVQLLSPEDAKIFLSMIEEGKQLVSQRDKIKQQIGETEQQIAAIDNKMNGYDTYQEMGAQQQIARSTSFSEELEASPINAAELTKLFANAGNTTLLGINPQLELETKPDDTPGATQENQGTSSYKPFA